MVYSFDLGLNLKELYFLKLNLTFCQSCFIYRIKITASSWSSFFTLWGLSKVFLLFFPMLLSCGMTSSSGAEKCSSLHQYAPDQPPPFCHWLKWILFLNYNVNPS